jgi:hypothetical protein
MPDGKSPLKLSAEAKLSATAKYSRVRKITEVVPEDVTRAKTSAWLTLISPITEWAGLKGDQLRHKRELLRVQQEETLYQIVQRARQRIEAEKLQTKPVPTKFLVPFLEKASLEQPNDALVELWANLLVSAGTNYNPHYIHFANIISQLSARQAQLFQQLIGHDTAYSVQLAMDSLQIEFVQNGFMQEYLQQEWKEKPPRHKGLTPWKALEHIFKSLNPIAVEIVHVEIYETKNKRNGEGASPPTSNYKDELQIDYEILAAVGLIRYVDTGEFQLDERWSAKVMFYHLTPLGLRFASACGILRDEKKEVLDAAKNKLSSRGTSPRH